MNPKEAHLAGGNASAQAPAARAVLDDRTAAAIGPPATAPRPRLGPGWLFALLLVLATLVAYQPAWQGKLVWDDDQHLTKPALRSLTGLVSMWTKPGVTQQYYPLTFSAFWVQHNLWGDSTLGYHLVNILLHCLGALLFLRVLQRIELPGAFLAAFIFALHPVHVESVAWMTELKNTLSGAFYLGAALAYLGFDRTRKRGPYFLSLVLFGLGLLAKTAIATLPAGLLVIFWWKRGRLRWKSDVLPLMPFFLAGLGAGSMTGWLEQKTFGATGGEFQLSLVERCLVAGRSIWFHLGKLFWPTNLIFMYPRWQVSEAAWWQYLYPSAVVGLVAGLWALRRRTRGPLAGLLIFVGTLFPALGFFNAYSFRYSFVNDHHQYLASLGMIALVSAGLASCLSRWRLCERFIGPWLCVALLAVLATLTWRQSRIYQDSDTLWLTTIHRNPQCWMALGNFGHDLLQRGQADEAIPYLQKALALNPEFDFGQADLGTALLQKGHVDEAIPHLQKALALEPKLALAHANLGTALLGKGLAEEAIARFQQALDLQPDLYVAHNGLGNALLQKGRVDEAIDHFQAALSLRPDFAEGHNNLGNALLKKGQIKEAIAQYQAAIEAQPANGFLRSNLAWILATCPDATIRNGSRAVELAQEAERLSGGNQALVLGTLAAAYAEAGRFTEAVATAQRALELAATQASTAEAEGFRARLALYQTGAPFRDMGLLPQEKAGPGK